MRSISLHALALLASGTSEVRELARFGSAIDLIVGDAVLALVLPEVGDGPFHAVVQQIPAHRTHAIWTCRQGELVYGPWRFALTPETIVWDPRPDWHALTIADDGLRHLGPILSEATRRDRQRLAPHYGEALEWGIARLSRAIVEGEMAPLETETRALAGLGPGLTPYGDDVLAGIILGLWAARHPGCWEIGRRIAQAAAPNTNQLSRAFLDAASQGLANAMWHRLLAALSRADRHEIERAAHQVVATGATSGAAMLRGFICGFDLIRR